MNWLPLKDLKDFNPIETAEYAISNKLADEPPSFGGNATLSDPVTNLLPDIGNAPINMASHYPILSKKLMKSMIKWRLVFGMNHQHLLLCIML
jgi:hypothetical protein